MGWHLINRLRGTNRRLISFRSLLYKTCGLQTHWYLHIDFLNLQNCEKINLHHSQVTQSQVFYDINNTIIMRGFIFKSCGRCRHCEHEKDQRCGDCDAMKDGAAESRNPAWLSSPTRKSESNTSPSVECDINLKKDILRRKWPLKIAVWKLEATL